ncbi:MAG: sugar/pyridoxal phosphate phosphatase YigL [Enterobacteriaceae bacterium]
MYHVVASDLDGTLLSPDHTLSPFSKKTLQLLTGRGIHFVFATGRHHVDVAQIRDGLDIDAFMITSNGARVHNTQGELIFCHNLAPEIAYELAEIRFSHPDITTHIYRNDDWFAARECPEEEAFFQESVFNYQLYQPETAPTEGVAKVFFTSDKHELLQELQQQIEQRWDKRVNTSFSLPTCLEVVAGGVSKGEALQEVVGLLGQTMDHCIAFGDGMNDKEMLAMVGKGCLMGNANPALKEALPDLEVIGNNADEAVAHYLRGIFL